MIKMGLGKRALDKSTREKMAEQNLLNIKALTK